ncbi:hypothetical protein LR48_Vigan10g188500 [Vigna angularis]|uniref:Uncharacterized protein n=1 Tax=Phaseolus angularis TaxID=3914 RepID=A0A0L9VM04_PHAAN|nr:hypothetical protein LR48_Vigan10g188500 [Vigna angularis]
MAGPKMLLGREVEKNSPFSLVHVRGLRFGRGNKIIGRATLPLPNQSNCGSLWPAKIITGNALRTGSATTHHRSNFFLSPREPLSEQERATAAASPSNFQIRVQHRNVASPIQERATVAASPLRLRVLLGKKNDHETGGRGRSVTRLPDVTSCRIATEKLAVEIDSQSGTPSGAHAEKFRSYWDMLAKTHVTIVFYHPEPMVKTVSHEDHEEAEDDDDPLAILMKRLHKLNKGLMELE